jgi:hypothetical protein
VVEGGAVTDLGPRSDVVQRHARARLRAHAGVLTSGLVNAHAHLEYGPPFADLATAGLPFAAPARAVGVSPHALCVRADLAVFDVPTDGDPYDALVEHGAGRCSLTAVAGRLVHRR